MKKVRGTAHSRSTWPVPPMLINLLTGAKYRTECPPQIGKNRAAPASFATLRPHRRPLEIGDSVRVGIVTSTSLIAHLAGEFEGSPVESFHLYLCGNSMNRRRPTDGRRCWSVESLNAHGNRQACRPPVPASRRRQSSRCWSDPAAASGPNNRQRLKSPPSGAESARCLDAESGLPECPRTAAEIHPSSASLIKKGGLFIRGPPLSMRPAYPG